MAKYRLLSREELENFRDEFVDYLVLNGIDIDEWLRLKKEEPKKSEEIIDLFSDVIMEQVLRKIEYLDHYTPRSIKTFKCEEKEIILIALETEDESYDFTTPEGVAKAQTNPPADLQIYTTTKPYKDSREMELYMMTVAGAVMSKGQLYNSLKSLLD